MEVALIRISFKYVCCVFCWCGPCVYVLKVQICKRSVEVMDAVRHGAQLAIDECQFQFRNRRWNCSTVETMPVFGKVVTQGKTISISVNNSLQTWTQARYCFERQRSSWNVKTLCLSDDVYKLSPKYDLIFHFPTRLKVDHSKHFHALSFLCDGQCHDILWQKTRHLYLFYTFQLFLKCSVYKETT